MLQSVPGLGVDAARVTRDPAFHQLTLRFSSGGRLQIARQDPPWKVVRAFPQDDGGSLVHLNNVSGGILAGDRLLLDAHVESGAAAQITTTGATRLYRHRPGAADSEQHNHFVVGDHATLEYLPDPLIPFAASRHRQRTTVHLSQGSTLLWWEVMAPGRQAAGETFVFDRLAIHSSVYVEGTPVLREDFLLSPAGRPLPAAIRMAGFTHTACLCVIQQGRPPSFWRKLEDELNLIARAHSSPSAVWGASALVSDGLVVKGLSVSGRFVYQPLVEFWRAARLATIGHDAQPPRKVY